MILTVQNVSRSYGSHDVLLDVSLSINEGELHGLIGASGSGKTTLLHSLVGFSPIEEGSIHFFDNNDEIDVVKHHRAVKRLVGFASQKPSFYEKLTVEENMLYFASLYKVKKAQAAKRIDDLLGLVGLEDFKEHATHKLSQGMQKRLDIACSLVHDPKILILDEPMADLDTLLRKQMWRLLEKIKDEGKTVIVSSHILADFDLYCNSLSFLHAGRLHFFSSVQEVYDTYDVQTLVKVRAAAQHLERIEQMINKHKRLKVVSSQISHNFLEIETTNPEGVLRSLLGMSKRHKINIQDIEYHEKTLESVFEAIVNE